MTSNLSKKPTPNLHWLILGLVLVWVLFSGLFLAWKDSMTSDEGIHVASGYLALTRHEFRFDPEHPFLFKAISALPLLPLHLNLPPDDQKLWQAAWPSNYDSWQEAREWTDQWVYKSGNPTDLMLFLMRLPAVLLTVILCAFTFYLGKRWFSSRVGLLATIFTAFNPTILAHGHLANTDAPVAFMFLLTIFCLWRYWEEPILKRALQLGFVLGLAQLVKFSAPFLVIITIVWLLYVGIQKKIFHQVFLHLVLVLLLAWVIIWLGYGAPLGLINGYSNSFRGAFSFPPLFTTPILLVIRFFLHFLPVDYVKGLALVSYSTRYGRYTYILGHQFMGGVWYYFPVVYALKTQLAGLFLLLWGTLLGIFRHKKGTSLPIHLLLIGSILLYGLASMANKLDIGIRHILPLLVFFSFYMALSLDSMTKVFPQLPRWIPSLLLILYILPTIIFFTNPIGYINELASSPSDAYRYFDDSNIDWGQQAKEIGQVVHDEFGNEPVYTNYKWNPYALEYYGVTTRPLTATTPYGALIMLTTSNLADSSYVNFQKVKPVYQIANTTYFYRLTEK